MVRLPDRDRESGKFLTLVLLIATLAPIAILYGGAYERAVARIVVGRLIQPLDTRHLPVPGDIVVVNGRVAADSVRMPPDRPQFGNAMRVVALTERWHWRLKQRGRSSWYNESVETWTSPSVAIDGWKIDASLIANAGFPWYRASPCSDYTPSNGWIPDCATAYLRWSEDENVRFSYEIMPIPDKTLQIVAQVSRTPGTLTAIERGLMPDVNYSLLSSDQFDVAQFFRNQTSQAQGVMHAGFVGILLIGCGYMMAAVRGARRIPWRAAILPAAWRAAFIAAPFASLYYPFEAGALLSALIYASAASFSLALFLWWRLVDVASTARQAPRTITRRN